MDGRSGKTRVSSDREFDCSRATLPGQELCSCEDPRHAHRLQRCKSYVFNDGLCRDCYALGRVLCTCEDPRHVVHRPGRCKSYVFCESYVFNDGLCRGCYSFRQRLAEIEEELRQAQWFDSIKASDSELDMAALEMMTFMTDAEVGERYASHISQWTPKSPSAKRGPIFLAFRFAEDYYRDFYENPKPERRGWPKNCSSRLLLLGCIHALAIFKGLDEFIPPDSAYAELDLERRLNL